MRCTRRATVAGHLVRDSVGLADLVPLVVSQHRDNGEFSQDHGPMDGSGYLPEALNTQTNMSTVLFDGNKCLESGPQGSRQLLLHRHNLQNLILEGCPKERVSDLRLPDGLGEEISRDLIFMSLNRWPSLVTRNQSLTSARPQHHHTHSQDSSWMPLCPPASHCSPHTHSGSLGLWALLQHQHHPYIGVF